MNYIVMAMLIGLIPAAIAKSKGKSFGLWWLYGAGLFIIALPHALMMDSDKKAIETQKMTEGMKKCPYCAEFIQFEAKICRYCHKEVPASETKKCRQCNYQVKLTEPLCPSCKTIQ